MVMRRTQDARRHQVDGEPEHGYEQRLAVADRAPVAARRQIKADHQEVQGAARCHVGVILANQRVGAEVEIEGVVKHPGCAVADEDDRTTGRPLVDGYNLFEPLRKSRRLRCMSSVVMGNSERCS